MSSNHDDRASATSPEQHDSDQPFGEGGEEDSDNDSAPGRPPYDDLLYCRVVLLTLQWDCEAKLWTE